MGNLFTVQIRLDSGGYREYQNTAGDTLICHEHGTWKARYSTHHSYTECRSEAECLAYLTDVIVLRQAVVEGDEVLNRLAIGR